TLVVGHRPDLLTIDLPDDITPLHASLTGRAALFHASHDHAVVRLEVELAGEGRGDRPHFGAKATRGGASRRLLRLLLVWGFADLDVEGLLALVAPHPHLRVLPRLGETDRSLEVRGRLDLFAVELEQDVAGLQARLGSRAVGNDVGDQDALGVLGVERLRQFLRERLNGDAQPAARDATLAVDLCVDLPRHVRRNGEADARPARDDGGVDTDHLALHVHEGTAGIAGIDRGVGLDEIVEGTLTDVARLRADDAGRHRGLQPERRADGDDPITHLHPVRVSEPRELELRLAVVELEDRQIRLLVGADDFRPVFAAIQRDDLDLRRLLDDVRVRQRDSGAVHDDPRAEAPLRNALGRVAEEPLEEIL